MFKKNLILIIASALLLAWQPVYAAAVKVEVGSRDAQPGESVELPITVTKLDGAGVISMDLGLKYDASILSFSRLDKSGTMLENKGALVYKNSPGTLNIAIYNVDALKGRGNLLKVSFKVSGQAQPGKTSIAFKKVLFNEGRIKATGKSGTVKILSPKKPELPQK
ncbi:MAG: hypothetical protein FJZ13_03755 [Candidatus Omnitrophica bacterium]|nr:hypothetical protein [Candidatus Omnitrophota bacterium]